MQPWECLPDTASQPLGALPMLYRLWARYIPGPTVERDVARLIVPWLQSLGIRHLACVGFCFGGWMVGRSLALPHTPFSCGVGIHPSWNIEQLHGSTEAQLAEAVSSTPCLLLPAGNDRAAVKPGGVVVSILASARCSFSESIESMALSACCRQASVSSAKSSTVPATSAESMGFCTELVLERTKADRQGEDAAQSAHT